MKNIWIIANWKSNKNLSEALEWVSIVGPNIPQKENLPADRQGLKVVVCPQFSGLEEVKKRLEYTKLAISFQKDKLTSKIPLNFPVNRSSNIF